MKVIDLLNKIANGEEVPKKIRVFGEEFELDNREYYSVHSSSPLESYFGQDYFSEELKYVLEVIEPIEDEFIDIEEITIRDNTIGFPNGEWTARNMDKAFAYKINEIIKNQKKIIERLDK